MHKTKQELCDMQKKLAETIPSLTEEKNVANAKIKPNLTKSVSIVSGEVEGAKAELEKSKSEVEKLTSELNVADAKRILTLEQELETTNKFNEDRLAELKALHLSASNTDSRATSLNEQIKALTSELELTKQNAHDVMTKHAALLLSTQEATRTYTEEIERLTQQLHDLRCTSEGPDKELEKELENATILLKPRS
ncbi:hypothetical protein PsorP6_011949 [Peronosclerospora sorghi]|uniref:Uncharacterized protein n=1 Tax=Peronosclerospora sorghi TaxID=230839 RepID=A0ACC0WMM0_9STRA|nr:hypothetical protein PsorP6_011949 [Peronosclerospora sorghi]